MIILFIIGAIALFPHAAFILWVGTKERNFRILAFSVLVLSTVIVGVWGYPGEITQPSVFLFGLVVFLFPASLFLAIGGGTLLGIVISIFGIDDDGMMSSDVFSYVILALNSAPYFWAWFTQTGQKFIADVSSDKIAKSQERS